MGGNSGLFNFLQRVHLQLMKLEIKEIHGVPVTGIPNGSRTEVKTICFWSLCHQKVKTLHKNSANLLIFVLS